jgi:hypothetical protein
VEVAGEATDGGTLHHVHAEAEEDEEGGAQAIALMTVTATAAGAGAAAMVDATVVREMIVQSRDTTNVHGVTVGNASTEITGVRQRKGVFGGTERTLSLKMYNIVKDVQGQACAFAMPLGMSPNILTARFEKKRYPLCHCLGDEASLVLRFRVRAISSLMPR